MKNASIGKKVMTLLGGAGLFLLAVAAFAGWQIGSINSSFKSLTEEEITADASFSQAIRAFADIRGDISDLLISTTDEGNKAALSAIKSHRTSSLRRLRKPGASFRRRRGQSKRLELPPPPSWTPTATRQSKLVSQRQLSMTCLHPRSSSGKPARQNSPT